MQDLGKRVELQRKSLILRSMQWMEDQCKLWQTNLEMRRQEMRFAFDGVFGWLQTLFAAPVTQPSGCNCSHESII